MIVRYYVIVRPSVMFVRPTQAIEILGIVSTPFGMRLSVNIQVKFYDDRPWGVKHVQEG